MNQTYEEIDKKFTFQSGDIQMISHNPYLLSKQNLHSNLVIFKLISNRVRSFLIIIIYIPIWWYSNKVWSNKSYTYSIYLHSNLVIFKWKLILDNIRMHQIYIPIWWYSNFAHSTSYLHINSIYIPIWWYSNKDIHYELLFLSLHLHSNLVIFKLIHE